MSPGSGLDALPQGWMRSDYMELQLPTMSGVVASAPAPAVPITLRNPPTSTLPDASNIVQGRATIDTGAVVSSVPMWAVRRLGIPLREKDKQHAFGVGWRMDAYRVQVCIDAWIGGRWLDLGVVTALSPDTKWSRSEGGNPPILLGRDGFFDKFNVCFDEPNRTMRLRRIDGAQPEQPQRP